MGSGESRMDLNQVTSEKDLGITFQDDLSLPNTCRTKSRRQTQFSVLFIAVSNT